MCRTSAWIGWALCLCASLSASAQDYPEDDDPIVDLIRGDRTVAEPAAEFLRCNKPAWRVPGQYLVILREGTHESHVQRTIRRLRAKAARRGYLLEILQTYSGALRGFLVKMSSDVLQLVVKLPHVHYVEEDSSIFAQSAPWNLQRLLHPHGGASENGTYQPPNDGGMAEVYLMDGSASQCDSHGTHIAGVVSGSDSGVARGAGVNLVRVLNCQGKGTVSGALAGMEYIQAILQARPVDAVIVLLPFVGGFSRSLNAACRYMVANGAVVIAAAGNYRDDACLYSPASEPEVITVGAVNAEDQLMSQGAGGTNVGRCVDLFAPGDDIVSASSDCSTCFTTRSVAAVILSSEQSMSPVQILQTMLHYSISNTINLHSLSEPHHLTTPNLVAAMPPANSTYGELLCRSVWSERSGVARTDRAVSRCRKGEEMMGCSSYAHDGVHVGETITINGGQMECVAHNGAGGKGVYAVARCCVTGGLRCQAHASPEPGRDAECVGPQHQLTDGVMSHAVCCHAPSLECHLLENTSADGDQVKVSCPSGWTLTDCNAASLGSALLWSVAKGNSCHVHGATLADGVAAIGVCCRTTPEQHATPPHSDVLQAPEHTTVLL
ncbi:hypothetical protein INR49_008608, partial [Caranx melampygus]